LLARTIKADYLCDSVAFARLATFPGNPKMLRFARLSLALVPGVATSTAKAARGNIIAK
jgi:hypothetical protein